MALPLSYNIRSLYVRVHVTLLAIGGIALVVAVLTVLIAMAMGFRLALQATGSPENVIVTQRGSQSELTSGMSRENANVLSVNERVQRNTDGQPLASPEMVVVAAMVRNDGASTNIVIRGVTKKAFEVRTGIRLVEGRAFQSGLYEVIVGRRIRDRMRDIDHGRSIDLQRRQWSIVGVFEANGNGFESEIWGDVDVMGPAFNRDGYQSLTMRMRNPLTIPTFNAELERNPRMQLQAVQERQYYEEQSGEVSTQLLGLAGFVAIVMGIGAIFGAMNTMYAIVAARSREIGTLRALGFSQQSILTSFVIESIFLAIVGGTLGCLIALPADGISSAAGGANFAEVAFAFKITPIALGTGMLLAILMGVIGGVLPAFRAAKVPVVAALRDV
tara:strand:- start:1973 stop:3133 length:1161 start_codon:yes stop_codon:yes gene_type:complete